jgi:CubicO group peptidase (beta-lactamase class C family)
MSNPVSRRTFLALAGASFIRAAPIIREPPVSGEADAGLAPFDRLLTTFVWENKVPGASLAVTRQGKLVYARGFGYADRDRKRAVRPESLFRIASVSKPITAVAVLQLVEQKKLKLDDKVWGLLKLNPFVAKGEKIDPRWKDVTVLHCLQHTGGWDRDRSFDPIGRPWQIAKEMGIATPVSPANVVRYMMGKPLDFAPGQRDAYSNLGYLVLGRLIANLSGKTYEAYVREKVFAPLKVKAPRLGRALVEKRVRGEVLYYDSKGREGTCLYPPRRGKKVPQPDGADNFEAFEAHGGWIASAIDLVKFASAFDDPKKSSLLGEKTIQTMWARPDGAAGKEKDGRPRDAYYGCGWNVRPVGDRGKANAWHTGYIPGTEALLVRRHDGLNWAVLFNTTGADKSLSDLIDGKLHAAADQVKKWPDKDLFETPLK